MNLPPTDFIDVPHADLQAFVFAAAQAGGLPKDRANLLADLLTTNDLRGVFSHGTTQIATYARLLRDGVLNPRPDVHTVRETPVSVMVDGDGGLGYFPAYAATLALIDKAKEQGVAVALTTNHGHFGAAGIYARLPLAHDLLTFVTSGHQLQLEPGQPLYSAAGGSPMAFSAPGDEEGAIVLDFGAMHELYADSPYREAVARLTPGIVLRSIGMGAICQAWGGFLAGVPFDPAHARRTWAGANQGALVMAFRIDLFMDPQQFKREIDAYVRAVHELEPLAGFDRSFPPGGVEAYREQEYGRTGIPVGPEHRMALEALAAELGLTVPWTLRRS